MNPLWKIAARVSASQEYRVQMKSKPSLSEHGNAWGDWAFKWFSGTENLDSGSGFRREKWEDHWDTKEEFDRESKDELAIMGEADEASKKYTGRLDEALRAVGYDKMTLLDGGVFIEFPCDGPQEFLMVEDTLKSVMGPSDQVEKEFWDTWDVETSMMEDRDRSSVLEAERLEKKHGLFRKPGKQNPGSN